MGLTVPPSLSNALPAMHAASPAWTGPSSSRCPCLRLNRLDHPSAPNTRWRSEVTAPPARPTIHPSTSAPPTRCTTAASASPTCPLTTRTRLWPCRCPLCTAPCWGTPSEADLRISTPTPEPSALRCNLTTTLTCEAQLMVAKWTVKQTVGTISGVFCYFHTDWGRCCSILTCSREVWASSCSSKPCKCRLLLCLYSMRVVVLWVSCCSSWEEGKKNVSLILEPWRCVTVRFSMQVVTSSCSVIFPQWLKRAFGTARSWDPSSWCADLEQRQRCDKDLLENDAKKNQM